MATKVPAVLSEKTLAKLEEDASEYDYVRFSWPDMNGILRGKTAIGRHAPGMMRSGIAEYTGWNFGRTIVPSHTVPEPYNVRVRISLNKYMYYKELLRDEPLTSCVHGVLSSECTRHYTRDISC